MAKQKYYVVWVGRNTGIFTDWASTSASVSGYPGAKHKSYSSREEAESAYTSTTGPRVRAARKSVATEASATLGAKAVASSTFVFDPAYDIHIFSDGACVPNPGNAGSGVSVYQSGKLIELHYGVYEPHGTNNTAELNALHQALLIAESKLKAKLKVMVLSDSTYSINVMSKWAAAWKRDDWNSRKGKPPANVELVKVMFELFSSIRRRMKLEHVSAHVGIEGNELADRLSLLAIKDKESGFVAYDGLDKVDEMLAAG